MRINFAYSRKQTTPGHVYANWSQSFKTPTLAQLFDQRQIVVGPPFGTINFANADLRPQLANSFEVGAFQRLPIWKDRVYGEASVSAYRIKLRDEIDFDLRTFRYGNIQRSRHDGLEATATFYFLPMLSVTHTVTVMDVVFRDGANEGNRLKNIPELTVDTHLSVTLPRKTQVTLTHRFVDDVFLDDENTVVLPGQQIVDGKVTFDYRSARFYVTGFNLTDKQYNSSGYVLFDPVTQANVSFLYPAGGRRFQSGVVYQF